MASVLSVERFLHSKRANFVISESRSQIYLGYAEYKQNLDKNRIIKEEKYLRNLCHLWEINNKNPCIPCIPCEIKLYRTHVN